MPTTPLLGPTAPYSNGEGRLGDTSAHLPLFPHNRGMQGAEVPPVCPPFFPSHSQLGRLTLDFRETFQHFKLSLAGLCHHRRWFPEWRGNH